MDINIRVIGFDGLNNSGKGTQISLLRNKLAMCSIPSVVMRGDGRRRGEGLEVKDPYSTWWQEYYKDIRALGIIDEDLEMSTYASVRLNRELNVMVKRTFPTFLKYNSCNIGVVILDRTIISRIFTLKQFKLEAGYGDVETFPLGRGNKMGNTIVPDLIVLLHTDKDILMARSQLRDDPVEKIEFNNRMISNNYAKFEDTIGDLPQEIEDVTVRINANKKPDEIFHEVSPYYNKIIFETPSPIEQEGRSLGIESQ